MQGKEPQNTMQTASAKKVKVDQPSSSDSCNLEFIYNNVRKRIMKWQRKQDCDKILELRERKHYSVHCQLDTSNQLDVFVSCEMCNKRYKLNDKTEACGNTVIMISNWTSHIKKCIANAEQNSGCKQVTISKFVKKVRRDSITNKDVPSEVVANVITDSSPLNTSNDASKQITSDPKDDCIIIDSDTSSMPNKAGSSPQGF